MCSRLLPNTKPKCLFEANVTHDGSFDADGRGHHSTSEMPIVRDFISPAVIGRDMDMLLLEAVLEEVKIVNILGNPGVGKTTFMKYLQTWWTSSDFADRVFYFDCQRDTDLWSGSTMYGKIFNMIHSGNVEHLEQKTTIHKAPHLIFLDNVEPQLAQLSVMPGDLSPTQLQTFYDFLRDFQDPDETNKCKLVFASRKAL